VARVLVRLKLRLLANGLRGSPVRAVAFTLGCLYAVGLASAAAAGFLGARHDPANLGIAVELAAVGVVVGWAALPLVGFGSDETLDPTRLVLLPLRRRELMAGLLGASLVGPGGLATAIGLAGATVALLPPSPGALLVPAAAVVQLAMCAALGRAVVTALSAALRTRRARDLRILLVAVIGLAPEALRLASGDAPLTDITRLGHWAHALSWAPATWPARAMVAARSGHWAAAFVELAGGVVTLVVVLWWWSRSLERVMTTAETLPSGPAVRTPAEHEPLFDPGLGFLPRNRTGAVAAKELRYAWRDPRRRVQAVSGVVLPFVLLAGALGHAGLHHHLVYTALIVAFLAGTNRAINQIGVDGPAFWVHEAAGQDLRADLTGKNLAVAFVTLPLTLLTALVLAVISGGYGELAVTAAVGAALIALLLGVGDVASVLLPLPMPDSAANVWATQSGQGCATGLLSLGTLVVEAVVAAPIVIAAVIVTGAAGRALVVIGALVYGTAVHVLGLSLAVRLGRDRGPELLERISPRQVG
jgi:ABC-2 type transport system permease protein